MNSAIDQLLRSSGLPRAEAASASANRIPGSLFFLHAGHLFASGEPTKIVTIVGSCVSVCLFDAARGVGGANHFMLPGRASTPSPRYAKDAMDLLLAQLIALGARRSRLEAKLFGGASMLKVGTESNGDLGMRNIEAARFELAAVRIPVVGEDVAGNRGRKLVFSTADGTVLVKQV
jgi:chemotaxis protein CheD